MKALLTNSVIAAFLALTACVSTLAAEPPTLTHNPFARPSTDEIEVVRNASGNSSESFENLQLTATMVAGSSRLVNVDGRVVRAGEQIYGYTLQRVYEDRAVFVKNGKTTTILVKPNLEEEYEQSAAINNAN